ncbi:MAG: CPBP family intramembrane metalloprotease [Lachnospiraceae bacterium]|nr:CPBP family intramembrane metalloprotease [Lachnospiraceae bacterium]
MKKWGSILLSLLTFFIASLIQLVVSVAVTIIYTIVKGTMIYSDSSLSPEEFENQLYDMIENIMLDQNFVGIATFLATTATLIVGGFCYYFFFVRKNKQNMKLTKIIDGKCLIQLIVLGIGVQFVISGILNIIIMLNPFLANNEASQLISMDSIFMIWSVILLAPIAEEIIYRGIVLRLCEKSMSFAVANVIQALLFGIYHMNLVQGIYAFFCGLVLGYICKKRKSIIASIFLHMVVNISSYFMDAIERIPISEVVLIFIILDVGGIFMLGSLLTIKEPEEEKMFMV